LNDALSPRPSLNVLIEGDDKMSAFPGRGRLRGVEEPIVPELALYISAPTMIGGSGLLWAFIYFSVMNLLP
jgi:hypothetical protein